MSDVVNLPEPSELDRPLGLPESELEAAYEFLRYTSMGKGINTAALLVRWTPAKAQRLLRNDDGFMDLYQMAREVLIEDIEEVLVAKARGGHMRALEMVLFNLAPKRWRDRSAKNDTPIKADINITVGVKEGIMELIRGGHVKDLQPAIETTARDADED